jgi:hypothetical protein
MLGAKEVKRGKFQTETLPRGRRPCARQPLCTIISHADLAGNVPMAMHPVTLRAVATCSHRLSTANALNTLCDPQATIDRADATALASALLLELRRSYQAKGGRLGTWARSPRY